MSEILYTDLENGIFDKHWKRNHGGQVKLCCPYCSKWFLLGSDFTVDSTGCVSDVVYHICDIETDDDDDTEEFGTSHQGWVVRPKLIGWR